MKYIGLDLGSVTCGISRSTGHLAQAVETMRFKPDDYDACLDRLLEFLKKEKPDLIVLGYPLLENGDAGEKAQLCEEFGRVLEYESGIKVVLQDERRTTRDSLDFLIAMDVSRKKRKKIIDQQAAVRILQYYLDAHREEKKKEEHIDEYD